MDWSLPTLTSAYADFLTYIKGRDTDLAKGLDPAAVTVTNPETGFIRWNSASNKWEIFGGVSWANLSSAYDINVTTLGGSAAALYAKLASPAFSGTPTAPTPAAADNTTKIATTAYVQTELASYAPLASPALTGNPTAPTQTAGNNSTRLATTAFVTTAVGAAIASGTKMLFQQTSAPTGWTKDTTHNNKALRVVSGTASSGGSVAFTTAFASQSVAGTVGNTTLTTSQIPSHAHNQVDTLTGEPFSTGGGCNTDYIAAGYTRNDGNGVPRATQTEGAGGSHNHSFTGTAINLAVQYVDVIIATKD